VIGLAPKQLAYSLELPVGEPERAVDRLFFDLRQSWFSLSARMDVAAVELAYVDLVHSRLSIRALARRSYRYAQADMGESKLRLRRAGAHDVDYLLALQAEPSVAPFLSAGRASTREELRAEIERSLAEPESFGRFLVETPFEQEWRLAGTIAFECVNTRSLIARVGGLAIHPDFRGHDLGAAAIRELARVLFAELESAGFVREGVKRRAYRPAGEWVDAVEFGLLAEELEKRDP
jgi:RimJ/RimL family protein N-acetyltransferase